MKLYYAPLSTYSQKVLIALNEKNVEVEREIVNLMDPDAAAAFRRDVYPLGKVPYLLRDNGQPIPESSIIIEYLDTEYQSGTQLIPNDKTDARRTRFYDRVCDSLSQ